MLETSIRSSDEYRETMRKARACRLRKAGLLGKYQNAECEQGANLYELAKLGTGAYVWGNTGAGKTYAAASAVRHALKDGKTAKLITSKRLLDQIKDGYDDGLGHALESAETTQLLVLDDLGAERATDWAIETISRLIDTRYMSDRPTIITSNYRLGELRDIWTGIPGARIASRIAGACKIIHFDGEDRRMKNAN